MKVQLLALAIIAQTIAPPAPSRFTDTPAAITPADCTAAKIGDSIPVKAIGEPVSGVTLSDPTWIAASEALPARCEVGGRLLPIDTAATARPIEFRVWLPA